MLMVFSDTEIVVEVVVVVVLVVVVDCFVVVDVVVVMEQSLHFFSMQQPEIQFMSSVHGLLFSFFHLPPLHTAPSSGLL